MLKAIATFLALVWAFSAAAQPEGPPRVTGQNEAAGTEIVINELNIEAYPDVLILGTVLRDGEPVPGLEAEDFRVREDEIDQEPLAVEPQLPPLSVVVAIDVSGSMVRRMDETREAAKLFVDSLGEGDSVQLLRFAREIEPVTSMTTTKETVSEAIDGLVARGDTALYDALYQSVDLLADRRGRRAVVLLSDGVDDDGTGRPLSERTIDDVLARAGEVGVPVYVVGLGTEMDEAVLEDIARTTGAQYLAAPEASELAEVYGRISDQLTGQYAIRYTSSLPADGTSRRVDLSALDMQASRSYTPEGSVTAAPEATRTAADGCAAAEAIEAEREALEQARDRHNGNLISITDRNAIRAEAMSRIRSALDGEVPDPPCIHSALDAAGSLHDSDAISITDRNTLRSGLVESLDVFCGEAASVDATIACLAFFRDAHNQSLISITERNTLRGRAFDRLVGLYAETMETDDALARLGGLYNDDLISITDRNGARQRLLDAERN